MQLLIGVDFDVFFSTCSNTNKRSTSGKASNGLILSFWTIRDACSCSSRNRRVCSAFWMICASKFYYNLTTRRCLIPHFHSFPGATNETLLQKFNSVHKENTFYEKPQRKENAFIIKHYAGKVKYQVRVSWHLSNLSDLRLIDCLF